MEIEKEMSVAIAKYTPFSADDIFSAWLSFKSFDLILRAVEFARVFGISTVNEAVSHLVGDYIRELRSGLTPHAADGAKAGGFCECSTPDFAPFIECQNCGKPPRS